MLRGPLSFVAHLFAPERIVLALLYLSSAFATLYSAMHMRSLPLTALFSAVEVWNLEEGRFFLRFDEFVLFEFM